MTDARVEWAPAPQEDTAIDIEGVVVKYGRKRAVDGLSLTVPRGTVYGFLGPNGAGKTSTIKTLMGFRKPDGGSAKVLGYDVVAESLEVRARVGFASEVNSLYEGMTVPRICRLCRDLSRSWDQDLVDRYTSVFGLPGDAKIRKPSKGRKAQLRLCLALGSSNPELLILNEPTSGLDPVARRAFLKVLVGGIAAEDRTVFFSTHLLSTIEVVADTVGIIKGGRLLVGGELDEMRASHRVLRIIYAETPPEEEVRSLRTLPDVQEVEREGRGIKLRVRGDVEGLKWGLRDRPHPIVAVDSTGMSLEDIFVAYVEDARDRQRVAGCAAEARYRGGGPDDGGADPVARASGDTGEAVIAKELRNVWWMLALGVLIFLPVLISGPTPYAQLVEIAKRDNVFLDMRVPSMFEEDAGVPKDPVRFAAEEMALFAEEMALFFGAVGKTFLIPVAAVLGVGLISAEAGRSTTFFLLSRPVGRDRVLLTKWAVGAVALLGIVAFFGIAFVASAAAKGYPLDFLGVTGIGLSILLLWLGSLSVFGLALAISVSLRNLTWSAIAILASLVLTWALSNFLYGFWMNYFLDDGESLRLGAEAAQRTIIPYYWSSKDLYLGDAFALVNFAVCLLAATLPLLAALWAFRRRAF